MPFAVQVVVQSESGVGIAIEANDHSAAKGPGGGPNRGRPGLDGNLTVAEFNDTS